MLKKYLLYLLFSLIVSGMVSLWWKYEKNHQPPQNAQIHKAIEDKVQNDPEYQKVKDLQDLQKSVTE